MKRLILAAAMSHRQAAKALGVDESTVRADLRENPADRAGKSRAEIYKVDEANSESEMKMTFIAIAAAGLAG